jgi:hypothetical protein
MFYPDLQMPFMAAPRSLRKKVLSSVATMETMEHDEVEEAMVFDRLFLASFFQLLYLFSCV